MWVIGAIVCLGLMLAGHGIMGAGHHGSHAKEHAAVQEPASAAAQHAHAAAPGDTVAETAQVQAAPERGHHHP